MVHIQSKKKITNKTIKTLLDHYLMYNLQPHSQSSSVILDVTSPVKLVGKMSRYRARFQASSAHPNSANWCMFSTLASLPYHKVLLVPICNFPSLVMSD